LIELRLGRFSSSLYLCICGSLVSQQAFAQ